MTYLAPWWLVAGAGGGVGGGARVCGRTLGWRPWSSHTPKTNSRGRGGGRGDSAENLVKSLFDRIQGGLFEAGRDAFYFVFRANHS